MATYRILRIFDVTATQRAEMEFPDDAAALAYMATVKAEEVAGAYSGDTPLRKARIEIEDGAEECRVRFWLDRIEGGEMEEEIDYIDAPQAHERVEYAAHDLLASLRAILPYAESRAEDMDETADDALTSGRDDADEARAAANKAICAVDAAKALLASLDGSTDAADAAEGAAHLVIWELPYSPDVAKDALGHFTQAEAAALLGMDQAEIAAKLNAAGSFQTAAYHVERDE